MLGRLGRRRCRLLRPGRRTLLSSMDASLSGVVVCAGARTTFGRARTIRVCRSIAPFPSTAAAGSGGAAPRSSTRTARRSVVCASNSRSARSARVILMVGPAPLSALGSGVGSAPGEPVDLSEHRLGPLGYSIGSHVRLLAVGRGFHGLSGRLRPTLAIGAFSPPHLVVGWAAPTGWPIDARSFRRDSPDRRSSKITDARKNAVSGNDVCLESRWPKNEVSCGIREVKRGSHRCASQRCLSRAHGASRGASWGDRKPTDRDANGGLRTRRSEAGRRSSGLRCVKSGNREHHVDPC
jgi:hypothetical protein